MKALPAIVILILIIVGATFFTKKSPDQSIPESSSPTPVSSESIIDNKVVYTSSGYSPATLLVKPGAKVTFVNDSESPMWTASDPHPIHSDFSSFDSRKGVATGGRYEFTFAEVGTYSYHNHLSPGHFGTITVEN